MSSTSSWGSEDLHANICDRSGTWRGGRFTDHSVNVFAMSRGPRQGSDICKDGPFGGWESQPDRSALLVEDLVGAVGEICCRWVALRVIASLGECYVESCNRARHAH